MLTRRWRIEFDGTLLAARADRGSAPFRRLPQRPCYGIGAAVAYQSPANGVVRAEYRRFGSAVDLDPAGAKAKLAPGGIVNLQARAPIGRIRGVGRLYIGATADNIFNSVVLPQPGLPVPKRMFRIGLQLD